MFALVDCNNFYASCERVFRPDLSGKPIVVASNNDGCIVARSKEAKALGIPMGVPVFKARPLIKQHRVQLFSSNYPLYGDFSRRIMRILQQFSDEVETYSIDEAFLHWSHALDHQALGADIQRTIQQWTGIPVSVGFGPTKTLSKLANHIAKTQQLPAYYLDPNNVAEQLQTLSVAKVWGIGRKLSQRLQQHYHIENVAQLQQANAKVLRQEFGVEIERTILELRGIRCFDLEYAPQPKQSIQVSRSFGQRLTEFTDLRAAISAHTVRAAEKLRAQQAKASAIYVYLHTSPFSEGKRKSHYKGSIILPLPQADDDTRVLLQQAHLALKRIFKPELAYQKAGVMLLDLQNEHTQQGNLFAQPKENPHKQQQLMQAIDDINHKLGRNSVSFASQNLSQQWTMRRNHRSPSYTTDWQHLPKVQAN